MELGQRLKQARLEAGMSQRQLCGQEITRNMLSQIENGSARPSMDTLRYFAARLGKPIGYFLEEQAVTSPNQEIMAQARAAYVQGEDALPLLAQYQEPDQVFDQEYYLLCALCRIELAKTVLHQGKHQYAWTLLEEAAQAGAKTAYYGPEQERARLLLCFSVRPDQAKELAQALPAWDQELILRAMAADDPAQQGKILELAEDQDAQWHLLRAEAYFNQKNYARAIIHYEKAPPCRQTYEKLEICCKELEDYKGAYYYAVKARE